MVESILGVDSGFQVVIKKLSYLAENKFCENLMEKRMLNKKRETV